MSRVLRNIFRFLFLAGCLIMAVNIIGLFVPLRNSEIYTDPRVSFPNDITLTYEEFKQQVQRMEGESDRDYIYRLTSVVNKGMAHYWLDEGVDKYRIRVPIWENYILYFGSLIQPHHLLMYHFQNIEKTMDRGVGWCSQQAMLITRLLHREGFTAETVFKPDHVVARVQMDDGSWLVADPDYGVVLPYDISAIDANPDIVRPYYASVPLKHPLVDVEGNYLPLEDLLVTIYSKPGTWVLRPEAELEALARSEETVYALKWVIPAGLIAPYLLLLLNMLPKRASLANRPDLMATTTRAS